MAKTTYDESSENPQDHLDEAANHLEQATDLNNKSFEVLKSGTGNTAAAATYRKAADEHLKLAQACRKRYAEMNAKRGLSAAFPKGDDNA